MERFTTFDGIEIAYARWDADSDRPWVVLQHGFIANHKLNWVGPGIVQALRDAGRRVIAVDARGHGKSDKPHEPGRYGEPNMARDLGVLFDRLGEREYDLVGYSMGAVISLIHATRDIRIRKLAVGGVGEGVVVCGGLDARALPPGAVAEALRSDAPATLTDRAQ